jgi:hypothetical protein
MSDGRSEFLLICDTILPSQIKRLNEKKKKLTLLAHLLLTGPSLFFPFVLTINMLITCNFIAYSLYTPSHKQIPPPVSNPRCPPPSV